MSDLFSARGGDTRLWHGGVPGLRVGELLFPGNERKKHDGCPWCEARSKGESYKGMDPPSAVAAVYVTEHKLYAKYHASLYGRGDLYTVEPIGETEPSAEDHFPSWTCGSARVVAVYQRAVLLTWGERRRLGVLWEQADRAADAVRAARAAKAGAP